MKNMLNKNETNNKNKDKNTINKNKNKNINIKTLNTKQAIRKIDYNKLLEEAFTKEGKIASCFSMFHNYSTLNCLIALSQVDKPEPMSCFTNWQKMGRKVKKGEKAISLLMPVKRKIINGAEAEEEIINQENNMLINANGSNIENQDKEDFRIVFIFQNHWFLLSQTEPIEGRTEGQKQEEQKFFEEIKTNNITFSIENLLKNANIEKVDFQEFNGNIQGYATVSKKQIAINPLNTNCFKTIIHEVAHILLGHNSEDNIKHSQKEVEAEGTVYLISSILNKTEDLEESRGYIQSYLRNIDNNKKEEISRNIIRTTNLILKYGKNLSE